MSPGRSQRPQGPYSPGTNHLFQTIDHLHHLNPGAYVDGPFHPWRGGDNGSVSAHPQQFSEEYDADDPELAVSDEAAEEEEVVESPNLSPNGSNQVQKSGLPSS